MKIVKLKRKITTKLKVIIVNVKHMQLIIKWLEKTKNTKKKIVNIRFWSKEFFAIRPGRIKILLHGQDQKKIGSVGRFFFRLSYHSACTVCV